MQKLENEKLDEIGKALLKAQAVPERELEEIIANPELFRSIQSRIAAATPTVRRSIFRPGIVGFATVALIAVVAGAFVVFRPQPNEVVQTPVATPSTPADVRQFREPDRISGPEQLPPALTTAELKSVTRKPAVVRQARSRRPMAQQARYEGEFYAVSYAGDPNETERGGRIVRVDIPRSTLFAMGVNIPLENEAETVKADLLVGNDGVTRAIRVVE